MLILTRKISKNIMVRDSISITVLGVRGNQVRIGIDAPADVAVHREEIYNRIQEESLRKLEMKNNSLEDYLSQGLHG